MTITQFNLYTNICFYKYAHDAGLRESLGLILNAFDVKFHEKKKEIPPRACRPPNKFKKFGKNEVGNGQPPRRKNRGFRGAAPPG